MKTARLRATRLLWIAVVCASAAACHHKKDIGGACVEGGATECESSLCVHVNQSPRAYLCSKRCNNDSQCPTDWKCNRFFPGPAGMACSPPAIWMSMHEGKE